MKRYWLFIFNKYYPLGGMRDFRKDFDTIEKAEKFFLKNWEDDDEGNLFDTKTNLVVKDWISGLYVDFDTDRPLYEHCVIKRVTDDD